MPEQTQSESELANLQSLMDGETQEQSNIVSLEPAVIELEPAVNTVVEDKKTKAAAAKEAKAAEAIAKAEAKAIAKATKDAEKLAAKEAKEAVKAAKVEKPVKEARIIQNGISTPASETTCGQIWAFCTSISNNKGALVTRKELIESPLLAEFNPITIGVQYYKWKTFHGLKDIKPTAEELAAKKAEAEAEKAKAKAEKDAKAAEAKAKKAADKAAKDAEKAEKAAKAAQDKADKEAEKLAAASTE
jgi:hypothetical protein